MDKCKGISTNFIFILLITADLTLKAVNSARPSKFRLPDRFNGNKSLTQEYIELAREYNPIDLFFDKPDFLAPIFVRNALINVTLSSDASVHQYSPHHGHPWLLKVLATLYSQLINYHLDPSENVIVTTGATEALYITFQTHTLPGDEWIIMEPACELYAGMIKIAGGVIKSIQLKPTKTRGKINSRNWSFNQRELTRLFNRRTKGIVINNPHNPTGKVFTKDELKIIANLAIKWNALVVVDEVYEWLIYKPNKHVRIASLPEMFERTITISSASKTFSVTGWRIGWAYGPSDLIDNLKFLHRTMMYSNPTPLQLAVASSIKSFLIESRHLQAGLATLLKELEYKRNYMLDVLEKIGMTPIVPEAGYFILANYTNLKYRSRFEDEHDEYDDVKFTKWLTKNIGILVYPVSDMFKGKSRQIEDSYIRFCFVKKNVNLQKAAKLLIDWVR